MSVIKKLLRLSCSTLTDVSTQLHVQWLLAITFIRYYDKWHHCVYFTHEIYFWDDIYAVVGNFVLDENRANMKFGFKLRKSATETLKILQQSCNDEAIGHRQCFKSRRTSLEYNEQCGRASLLEMLYCASIMHPLGPNCESRVLLQHFEAFDERHSAKTIRSVELEELDSLPRSSHLWISY